MSRGGAGLCLVSFFLWGPPSAFPSTWQQINERGSFQWGADIQGGAPYVYEDPNDPSRIIGFEVDIAEELGRRWNATPEFKQTAWSQLVPSLERADFDLAMNGLEATSDRRDRVLMSDPYYVYAETLAVKEGSPYRTLEDLKGKRVGTLNQTYAYDLLREKGFDPARYGGVYEGVQEPYWDVVHGKLDAVLLDNIVANIYGCPLDGIACVPGDIARGVYVILVRQGDEELQGHINRALADMRKDGTLERILRKWALWDHRQTEDRPPLPSVHRPRRLTWEQAVLFLKGAQMTLFLSLSSFCIAVPLGFALACARLYGGKTSRFMSAAYVEVFRGTPVLLQLYVLYFGIAPYIRLSAVQACIVGLGMNYAAYEAEIYRGALLSVPRGQTEAAHSLGLSVWQTIRHVTLPQGFRLALPPMTNDFIALLKDSSLVGVIAVVELTKRMTIAAIDMRGWLMPGLLCASLYFLMSFPLARWARRMEKRLRRDHDPKPS